MFWSALSPKVCLKSNHEINLKLKISYFRFSEIKSFLPKTRVLETKLSLSSIRFPFDFETDKKFHTAHVIVIFLYFTFDVIKKWRVWLTCDLERVRRLSLAGCDEGTTRRWLCWSMCSSSEGCCLSRVAAAASADACKSCGGAPQGEASIEHDASVPSALCDTLAPAETPSNASRWVSERDRACNNASTKWDLWKIRNNYLSSFFKCIVKTTLIK